MRAAVTAVWTMPTFLVLVFLTSLDPLSGIHGALRSLADADVVAMIALGLYALIAALAIRADQTRRYAMVLSVPPIIFGALAALYLYAASHLSV